jgi:hypothetical protein
VDEVLRRAVRDRALDQLGLPELVGRRWDGRGGQARA